MGFLHECIHNPAPVDNNVLPFRRDTPAPEPDRNRPPVYMPSGKYFGKEIGELESSALRWFISMAAELSNNSPRKWGMFFSDNLHHIKQELRGRMICDPGELEFTLSKSQGEAAIAVKEHLLSGRVGDEPWVMRLSGAAGYGKSYVLKQIILDAINRGFIPAAMSTSHVATGILLKDLKGFDIEIKTIASMLSLLKVRDGKHTSYELTENSRDAAEKLLGKERLLIVDEFSMVGDDIANLLIEAACVKGGSLLVVGDEKQLPSPAQTFPSKFCLVEPHVTLTEPMRYSFDSDLYRIEQLSRYNPGGIEWEQFRDSKEVILHSTTTLGMFESFADTVKSKPDETSVMLFHRRKYVTAANDLIRKILFGDSPGIVMPGEKLRVISTGDYWEYYPLWDEGSKEWMIPEPKVPGVKRVGGRYYSGEMLTVSEVLGASWMAVNGISVPVFRVELERVGTAEPKRVTLVFAETEHRAASRTVEGEAFNAMLGSLAGTAEARLASEENVSKKEAWEPYHHLKDSVIWVSYSYASTVHRTQGCTASHTFITYPELFMSRRDTRDSLMYVAMTRAAKTLHVNLK